SLSAEDCDSFLDPLIESWDIDLVKFGMDIVLSRRLGAGRRRRLVLAETTEPFEEEAGLREFPDDASLCGDATETEIAFLKGLRFDDRVPTALYYYRVLQNLRDPLHFRDRIAE
ncbi:XRE family transcriptional regulator, partial [bacterium]|nr:XRE family transcriptional regulator [bacterium]